MLNHPRVHVIRWRHRRELGAEMRAIFLQHPMEHWVRSLREAGCVVAPVAQVSEVCADDQLRANGVFKASIRFLYGQVCSG